ncbi:hypothetical protein QBC47DRAFT_408033 [Echria macrotheca]|uniref:Uncharacterized protein n=1 Tax=Echria macrotheca TaxID=438768 RepID=A0AAJ0F5R4_9PEZI|nr:hypothetical protein QBC47DRAFT_408033 [Echria macrotheca]
MAARLALLLVVTATILIQAEQQQGNSECAKWCKDNFPRGHRCDCIRLAARAAGPCFECGPPAWATGHPEKKLCGGVCIDTSAGNANCGACGTTCSADQTCTAGVCVDNPPNPPHCIDPFVLCGNICVDTGADNGNCGTCGQTCSAD